MNDHETGGCGPQEIIEAQIHELHQQEEEALHNRHVAEEAELHRTHLDEERLLHELAEKEKNLKFVEVCVLTTSGRYPAQGFNKVKIDSEVSTELKSASEALRLTDTNNWIVRVKGREIDQTKTYAENDLKCEVRLDFGPREGGGGSCIL